MLRAGHGERLDKRGRQGLPEEPAAACSVSFWIEAVNAVGMMPGGYGGSTTWAVISTASRHLAA
jgi:hypothetical protein